MEDNQLKHDVSRRNPITTTATDSILPHANVTIVPYHLGSRAEAAPLVPSMNGRANGSKKNGSKHNGSGNRKNSSELGLRSGCSHYRLGGGGFAGGDQSGRRGSVSNCR